MKQVYTATYKSGVKGPTKVFGSSEEDAKKAAFAAYAFTCEMWHPNPRVDDVVAGVVLEDDKAAFGGVGCQPCVQSENYVRPTAKEILSNLMKTEKENN